LWPWISGASKLVLAQFAAMRNGGLEILNYAVAPIGLDPEVATESSAYVVSAIRDMMRKSNIRPGGWRCRFPARWLSQVR